ncbi:type II toxin-antitoxin system VapC family toxin [Spirosoma utsteinense]|uniref:PIN domain nuclease of toxin-antitoxin system n=1 Tax=Spirosoma utsteinense TaxID=2585773 RepID=A0ABR6WAM8_9BACT|nr:type II toxin-antitoxin system VapC family toxin [Spirosoma utsteinense]MBC3787831.1 PIN domain nuclease of toxin-antitoxin system [Spirosoma utsteinense]MBC3793619.1 PIN domain nuclease of toxin-antitoxin system [Spirosoma utsteinense]
MSFLLDTEVLLWFIEGNDRLLETNRLKIQTADTIYVSQISLFEVAIKTKVGKLSIKRGLAGLLQDMMLENIQILPLQNEHIAAYDQIPFFDDHRDPFDRLILATALHEGWPVMTADPKFSWYKDQIEVIW